MLVTACHCARITVRVTTFDTVRETVCETACVTVHLSLCMCVQLIYLMSGPFKAIINVENTFNKYFCLHVSGGFLKKNAFMFSGTCWKKSLLP